MKARLFLLALFVAFGLLYLFFELQNLQEDKLSFETEMVSLEKGEEVFLEKDHIKLPSNGWVVGVSSEIIGGQKQKSLHHLYFFNNSRNDLTCQTMEERIFAAGAETTGNHFPTFFGYPVEKKEEFKLLAHIKNQQDAPLENIKLRLNIQFAPKSFLTSKIDLQPLFLDSVNCSYDPSFAVYPGKSQKSSESSYIMARDMRIAFVGGHLHHHGKKLEAMANNKIFWQAIPTVDHHQEVSAMPVGVYYGTKKLAKGEKIWVRSDYDNPTDKPSDGMGIAVVYLIK